MPSPALEQLESLLKARQFDRTLTRLWAPDAQSPDSQRKAQHIAATGMADLDGALRGGWRRGEVSEIVGGRSTGRTHVLVAALAAATARGEIVGLVDTLDRFDPVTAAAAGVDLDRLLWVRGPSLTVESARPPLVDHAIHQAIRAIDLIVRAGGFSIAALDLADVPPLRVRRLPYTTWMRLAHANEGRETACLLVGDAPMGKSARGVTVNLEASSRWTGTSPQSRRLAGFDIRMRLTGTWQERAGTGHSALGTGTERAGTRHSALGTGTD